MSNDVLAQTLVELTHKMNLEGGPTEWENRVIQLPAGAKESIIRYVSTYYRLKPIKSDLADDELYLNGWLFVFKDNDRINRDINWEDDIPPC